jgi:hypothetical protein
MGISDTDRSGRPAHRGSDRPGDRTLYQRSRTVVHTVMPMGRHLVASVVLQGPQAFLQPGQDSEHREEQLQPGQLHDLVAEVAAAV